MGNHFARINNSKILLVPLIFAGFCAFIVPRTYSFSSFHYGDTGLCLDRDKSDVVTTANCTGGPSQIWLYSMDGSISTGDNVTETESADNMDKCLAESEADTTVGSTPAQRKVIITKCDNDKFSIAWAHRGNASTGLDIWNYRSGNWLASDDKDHKVITTVPRNGKESEDHNHPEWILQSEN